MGSLLAISHFQLAVDHTRIWERKEYKIVNLLGSGGFGDVYKVRQSETGQFYALKTEDVEIDSRLNRLKV
ncbi:hypothetical protein NECAME_10469 [Necator americanus]|uniref:Protein kinase domain-containing protein n=1 Tax=Necator americanus TaxID=51031 RepID=W2TBA9_NECAM|nr:hypothetical protein NECAME_10469 [Necator americanus]ETN78272.1 hypothetical protein NECAME_10469 [Necator americanus]